MADDQERARARVQQLQILLRTLEREWREAEPDIAALGEGDASYRAWSWQQRWLTSAVEYSPGFFEQEDIERPQRVEASRRDPANVRKKVRGHLVPTTAERLAQGKPAIAAALATLTWVYFGRRDQPKDETIERIRAAVQARLDSLRDRNEEHAWTHEEKARALVRAALRAVGITLDVFASDRMKRHRAGRSGTRSRPS